MGCFRVRLSGAAVLIQDLLWCVAGHGNTRFRFFSKLLLSYPFARLFTLNFVWLSTNPVWIGAMCHDQV